MTPSLDDTICSLATPPGVGGIGVIRISGPAAFAVADAVTRRPRSVPSASFAGHTLHRADVLAQDGSVIDDVLLAIFHAPRSYTGENVVEVSAHGGPVPLRRILSRLLTHGARLAQPGEFTQRAFLNGKMDLAQAEAVGDIIAARTDEALALARSQQSGRLSSEVAEIRHVILGVMARIEASIDFPEDVGELDTDLCEREIQDAQARIARLLATADRGILVREGLKMVLAGRPNVGKSSLLNALLRVSRAIVTPIPGTTRDTLEESVNIRGIPVRAVDTAGVRDTDDLVEKLGVERSMESLRGADLVLLILDAAVGETDEDRALRAQLGSTPHVIVWNKCDLQTPENAGPDDARVSASTGEGIEALEETIAHRALSGGVIDTGSAGAVISHSRHRHALEAAQARLDDALATLRGHMPADFISIDVRGALLSLGEVTGETATEDIIHEIFSRFCIGK
ncbi:tRNA uridine-5-carboxymethylaminomethyl(34) synthesis GTPase MnmE [Capsulimonas corticalis]|uniref:tRNA uridine-5-carboxymethylaminomethyl(34) synthesis GTPase MnmE n=1 Tax=Capsulimonas corticalis TaxID=2219043 RepID=UPI001C3F91EF|nr:tRNA uridine-5-carboxymethylaminomethyl(34) synthesis GTPase MnmE [Capsulimonas corticalis]